MPSLLPYEVATAGATGRTKPTGAAFSLAVAVARGLFLVFVPLLLLVLRLSPLHVFTLLLLTPLLSVFLLLPLLTDLLMLLKLHLSLRRCLFSSHF